MVTRISRAVAAAVACLLAAVGTVVLVVVSPVALVAVLMVGAFVGVIVATHLPGAEPSGEFPRPSRARHHHTAGAAAAAITVSALLATAGAAALLGGAAAPLLLLLLAGTGAGLWRHRAAWRAYAAAVARPGTATPGADASRLPAPPPDVPGTLTVPALCLAWQRSQWALNGLPPGSGRAELIVARERLLDELERRDPDGFRRWLHRGVRANADPGHYLIERPTTRPSTGLPQRHDDDRRTQ